MRALSCKKSLPKIQINQAIQPMTALIQVLFFLSVILLTYGNTCQAQRQRQKETTDLFGNQWHLVTSEISGTASVRVVPLNKECNPISMEISNGFPSGKWSLIGSDINGFVWVGGDSGLIRFDPRKPNEGWRQFRSDDKFTAGAIKSMSRSINGLIQIKLKNGDAYEVDTDKAGQQIIVKVDPENKSAKTFWKNLASMPYGNHDIFGAELNGKIYIPGGGAPHGYPPVMTNFDRMMIYDTWKDTFKLSSPMRINRRYCNVGVLDGKIWVIGGFEKVDGKENATATVEIYDPIKDTWTDGPSLKIPCSQAVAGVVNGRLYVVFSGSGRPGNFAFSISATESQWWEETVPPYPVAQTDGCVFGNKLYILIPAVGLICYETATKQWQTGYPPFPNTKAPRAAAVVNYKKQIWVISGTDVEDETLVWRYTPDERKWTAGPNFPQSTLWADGLEVNGKLYVFGGAAYSKRHGIFVFRNRVYELKYSKRLYPLISNNWIRNEL